MCAPAEATQRTHWVVVDECVRRRCGVCVRRARVRACGSPADCTCDVVLSLYSTWIDGCDATNMRAHAVPRNGLSIGTYRFFSCPQFQAKCCSCGSQLPYLFHGLEKGCRTSTTRRQVSLVWSTAQVGHSLAVATILCVLYLVGRLWADYITTIACAVILAQALYLPRRELEGWLTAGAKLYKLPQDARDTVLVMKQLRTDLWEQPLACLAVLMTWPVCWQLCRWLWVHRWVWARLAFVLIAAIALAVAAMVAAHRLANWRARLCASVSQALGVGRVRALGRSISQAVREQPLLCWAWDIASAAPPPREPL